MGKLECQFHDVFFVVVLDDTPDILQNLDSLLPDIILGVIEKLIDEFENLSGSLILFGLGALLLNELNKRDELIQESNFDIGTFLSEILEGHHKTVNQKSLVQSVCEIHQPLCEIKLVVMVEVFNVGLDRLIRGQHSSLIRLVLILVCLVLLVEVFQILESFFELYFSLFTTNAPYLPLFKLHVHFVRFFVLQVQEFFIDEE